MNTRGRETPTESGPPSIPPLHPDRYSSPPLDSSVWGMRLNGGKPPVTGPSLDKLFWTHLFDLYASEKEVVLTLERLSQAAAGSKLQEMLAGYRKEAEGQVERLERIFERRDHESAAGSAESDAGAIWWKRYMDPDMLDAGLIIGVRFLAEYKIAAYRAAQRWATLLGYDDMIETLQVSLDEEERACQELIVLGEAAAKL